LIFNILVSARGQTCSQVYTTPTPGCIASLHWSNQKTLTAF